VSKRWRNWCQNEVYEERKEADSRDKVKHNGRSDQLFLEMMILSTGPCMQRLDYELGKPVIELQSEVTV